MIAGKLARELAQEFGTPLYVYDLAEVHKRSSELRALLPSGAKLFYSMKANPLPAVARMARLTATGAEISSEGELEAASNAGYAPATMLYTGPAKTETELRRAVKEGVGCFSAESLRDLKRIAEASRNASTRARVILRVNPLASSRTRLAMTGVPSQFGFEEDSLESLTDQILELDNVEVSGVHVYLGTQAPDADALTSVFEIAIDVAERLARVFPMRITNLGGGFPWPFASSDDVPNLEPLAQSLARLTGSREQSSTAELWFESGRYIAASCGTMIARVMDVKQSRGTTFYILDAGVASLGGMSGLGRILRPVVSLKPLEREDSDESELADVVGPLCTPLDCLARGVRLPPLQAGELVTIPNVGAYGATASLTGFLSRPTAIEVCLREGEVVDVTRLRNGHETFRKAVGVT